MKKMFILLAAISFLFLAGCGDDHDNSPLVNDLQITDTTYSISGTVTGDFSEGVTITLSGDSSATTTTASDGTYSFTALSSGNYTVTASLTGYTFSDAQSVVITNADVTGIDFTATNFLGAVTMTQATAATDLTIFLTWTDPTDADLDHISITWSDGTTDGSDTVEKGEGTYTTPLLDAETEYTITVSSVDTDGYTTDSEFSLYTSDESTEFVYSFIYTVAELDAVRDDLEGNYIMMADLDLDVAPYNADEGWTPIGYWDYDFDTGYYYSGIFNGNNHVISNLYINTDGIDDYDADKGLFGDIGDDVLIYNLGLESVSVTGEDYAGALAGYVDYGTIENCYASGTVNGDSYVGGLVGELVDSTIENCYASGTVDGGYYVGGLVGEFEYGTIENCYASGTVNGSSYVGGLVGEVGASEVALCYAEVNVSSAEEGAENIGGLIGAGYETNVLSCYATGSVTADSADSSYVGGLVGYGYTLLGDCYATGDVSGYEYVGGLLGYNDYEVYNSYATGAISADGYYGGLVGDTYAGSEYSCFYDIDTTLGGALGSATDAGTGMTTAEMKTLSTFTDEGWDFVGEDANGTDDIWDIDSTVNSGYPYLTMTADMPMP